MRAAEPPPAPAGDPVTPKKSLFKAPREFGVYTIYIQTDTGCWLIYNGRATFQSIYNRLKKHLSNTFSAHRKTRMECPRLYQALRRYGVSRVRFSVPYSCPTLTPDTENMIFELETQLIDEQSLYRTHPNVGLNCLRGGGGKRKPRFTETKTRNARTTKNARTNKNVRTTRCCSTTVGWRH